MRTIQVILVAVLAGGQLSAATLRGRVHAYGLGGEYYDVSGSMDATGSLGPQFGGFSDTARAVSAQGQVTGSPAGDHLLGLFTSTSSVAVAGSPGLGFADAFAAYRDTLTITGVSLPSVVRMTFALHANLSVDFPNGLTDGNAGVAAGFMSFDEQSSFSFSGASAAFSPLNGTFHLQGFDTTSGGPGNFRGTFSSLVAANDGLYKFQVAAAVSAVSFQSIATANALNTVSLVSITNADGSPIAGAGFTFASGMQPTPEPGTMTLAAMAALAAVFVRPGRRRK